LRSPEALAQRIESSIAAALPVHLRKALPLLLREYYLEAVPLCVGEAELRPGVGALAASDGAKSRIASISPRCVKDWDSRDSASPPGFGRAVWWSLPPQHEIREAQAPLDVRHACPVKPMRCGGVDIVLSIVVEWRLMDR